MVTLQENSISITKNTLVSATLHCQMYRVQKSVSLSRNSSGEHGWGQIPFGQCIDHVNCMSDPSASHTSFVRTSVLPLKKISPYSLFVTTRDEIPADQTNQIFSTWNQHVIEAIELNTNFLCLLCSDGLKLKENIDGDPLEHIIWWMAYTDLFLHQAPSIPSFLRESGPTRNTRLGVWYRKTTTPLYAVLGIPSWKMRKSKKISMTCVFTKMLDKISSK